MRGPLRVDAVWLQGRPGVGVSGGLRCCAGLERQASWAGGCVVRAMVVGILQIELRIEWSESLKDKRRVLSSLKDRLHREHQVSVAEVGQLEDHRVAVLGIAMASNSAPYCRSVLDKIVDKLRRARDCVLSDHQVQVLTGW